MTNIVGDMTMGIGTGFGKLLKFHAAGVVKLAYAADSKTSANGDSKSYETYGNLQKTSFKPTTGADFSPMSDRKWARAAENP
jgi:hypothetical protein